MNRRRFLRLASGLAGAAGAAMAARRAASAGATRGPAGASTAAVPKAGAPAGRAPAERPNIVFILADDLGQYDLGCCGGRCILTPNIDRLAAEGIRFTQTYAGSTVCAPSRSVLMTGQHTGHTTVRGNFAAVDPPPQGRVPLKDEDVTVAEVLKAAGYTTGAAGKWGLGEPGTSGLPNRQGFDFWFGYLNQRHAHNYWTDHLWRNTEKVLFPGNSPKTRKVYSHDRIVEESLGFIRRAAEMGRPFFLYAAWTLPHGDLHPPSLAPYEDRPWSRNEKAYAAMVTRLDRDVGRVMRLLADLGIDRNTIVFFTSDNGWSPAYCGQKTVLKSGGPLRGCKGNLYEGGIRVPTIVRWPGRVPAGAVSDQVWAFWDVLPTLAELAGADPPPGIDGVSMLPAILGRKQTETHEYLYWEYRTRGRFLQAVRWGRWKGIRNGTRGRMELYNLADDLSEKRDLAAEHPEVVKRIEGYMAEAHAPSHHWPALPVPRRG